MRASRFKLSKVAFVGVAVWVSPASGATTSGTSSEFSLRFMAIFVVCGVCPGYAILAFPVGAAGLELSAASREEILPKAVNPEL